MDKQSAGETQPTAARDAEKVLVNARRALRRAQVKAQELAAAGGADPVAGRRLAAGLDEHVQPGHGRSLLRPMVVDQPVAGGGVGGGEEVGLRLHQRAVAEAKVDLNPHQLEAAVFAMESLSRGGGMLADEVGLGKTIEEAGSGTPGIRALWVGHFSIAGGVPKMTWP